MADALVIIEQGADLREVMTKIGAGGAVKQRLPPRLFLVEGEPSQIDAIRHTAGVVAVYETPLPESVVVGLTPSERTFVAAWASRQLPKENRLGNGLAWDAEGFQPPDRKLK